MKELTSFLLGSTLLLWPGIIAAQESSITGIIVDEKKQPSADAIVQLLRRNDSSLVKTEITDEAGKFVFSAVKNGTYFIQMADMGARINISAPFALQGDTSIAPFTVRKNEKQLKEIAVIAKKPYIEREKGKVILNVESSINASGSSAFEVLEKAPGIRADNNDNLSVNGKPGTIVWIDGKPSPLTGSELANFLRTIPSSNIDRIEIIANPSARYDAAGTSIINIIMKKDKRVGTNGNVSLSYGQGVYPKLNNTLSMNHRDKKVNMFGSYSYARRLMFSHLQLKREFYDNGNFLSAFDQDNMFRFDMNSHSVRAGTDFYIDSKNTFGVMFNGTATGFFRNGNNTSDVYGPGVVLLSGFNTRSTADNHWGNYSGNINYKHVFDSAGTELSTDLDVATFVNSNRQNIDTRYYDLNHIEFASPYLLHGDLDGRLNIFALKNDLVIPRGKKWRWETGQKSSYVTADNNLAFYDRSQGNNILDTTKSNHFLYTENINAAYVQGSYTAERWSLQTGLRAEHTYVKGLQLVYDQNFERNYVQLFPSVVFSYKLNPKNAMEFNYSRRIRRPGYDQLNPFKYYLDPTTYRVGNPYLQPSTTESFELTHIYREKITTTAGFGRTFRNIIEVIAPVAGVQRVTAQTNVNLSMVDVYTLNGSVPLDLTKWWNTSSNFNLYYASYSGNVANTALIRRGNVVFNLNTVNTFSIIPGLTAELSASYQSREVYAFDVIEPIWSLNVGLQQKLFRNNGTLRLNVTDIFYTNVVPAHVTYTDYREQFLVQRDSRVATLSFSYRFGKNTVPPARRRQGGAEDVKQRAGGGVG